MILPPPQNLTHGNLTALIDPCFLTLNTTVESLLIPVKDLPVQVISENIKLYIQKHAWFKGTDCSQTQSKLASDDQVMYLKIKISNQTQTLIPPSLYDGDESYTFTLENDTITIDAKQYSGAMRGLATFTQLVE